jgi:hypothetical protein
MYVSPPYSRCQCSWTPPTLCRSTLFSSVRDSIHNKTGNEARSCIHCCSGKAMRITQPLCVFCSQRYPECAGPSDRAVGGVGLRPLACWDCGFESCRRHGCLSPVGVVCCQVEVSATGWSLFQRSPTECGVSECDHEA